MRAAIARRAGRSSTRWRRGGVLLSIAVAPDGHAFAVGPGSVLLHYDGTSWTRDVPPGTLNLRWVDARSGDFAVAVGASGSVVWRRGSTWTYDDTSGTTQPLFGVTIVAEDDVWASGANGTVIHWNGSSWNPSASGSSRHLYGILALGADDVYAVGTGGTILHYDGTGWTLVSPAWITSEVENVWAANPEHIWFSGTDGLLLYLDRITDTWTLVDSGTLETLYGIWGSSDNDIWAAGGWSGGIVLHYDGTSWTEDRSVPSIDRKGFRAVSGAGADNIFGALHDGGIMHYDGTSWRPMEGAITASLRSVWGSSGQEVFAAGSATSPDGTRSTALLRYDGTRWSVADWRRGFDARDLWVVSPTEIYLVGADQNVRRWDGSEWTPSPVGMFPDTDLLGAWGVAGGELFVVGGQDDTIPGGRPRAFHGTSGGGSWTPLLPPDLPDVDLHDVAGATAGSVIAVGTAGTILTRSGDNLEAAVSPTTETLRSVWADASGDAFAVGDNGSIVHWDGTAWSEMTSPSDPWFGFRLNAVWGSSPTNVFAAGEGSLLLRYDGSSWTQVMVDALADLTDVWGTAANNVFVVANDRSGIILHRCGTGW